MCHNPLDSLREKRRRNGCVLPTGAFVHQNENGVYALLRQDIKLNRIDRILDFQGANAVSTSSGNCVLVTVWFRRSLVCVTVLAQT